MRAPGKLPQWTPVHKIIPRRQVPGPSLDMGGSGIGGGTGPTTPDACLTRPLVQGQACAVCVDCGTRDLEHFYTSKWLRNSTLTTS